MARYRRSCPDYRNILAARNPRRSESSWFDHAQDVHRDGGTNLVHGQGASCVARDHQIFSPVFHQELNAGYRVTRDRSGGLGAVGQARGVADIEIVGQRNGREQFAQYRETTES